MSGAEVGVLVGSAVLIAMVLVYFFGPRRAVAATPVGAAGGGDGGVQEATIVVRGGYSPDTIAVRAGRPVRLLFKREESGSCSDEVTFPDLGLTRSLPAFQTTAVEFTPEGPGVVQFTCGMGMLRGRVVAE